MHMHQDMCALSKTGPPIWWAFAIPLAKCYNRVMQESFYFYDLETSGLNPRTDRIMQFAGQRTDLNFNPIGEPTNLLIQLADDTLPGPYAIMVTGITPQSTRQDGLSEREFCRFFVEEVATPGTTIMGYNSVRFDDEFIRHALWRNFHDVYGWQWKDGRSRWDLLDVVRMARALRPEGIEWPVTDDGRSTNRLELLTKLNHISHQHAHDALSDVVALIEVTKLLKQKQPQLFDFLYNMRTKREVGRLVNLQHPQPFVYASGRYPSEYEKTTVAFPIAEAPNGNLLVFDLRHNLDELLSGEEDARKAGKIDPTKPFREREPWERGYFPIVKKLQYNHCPAVAPLKVLDKANGWEKIGLTEATIRQNLASLQNHPEFISRMQKAQRPDFPVAVDPESALYDSFITDQDEVFCAAVRNNGAEDLTNFRPDFTDQRLPDLLLHYKAKNFPTTLSEVEQQAWEEYRTKRLTSQSERFLKELTGIQNTLARGSTIGSRTLEDCAYLAEELMLWYQSLLPEDY